MKLPSRPDDSFPPLLPATLQVRRVGFGEPATTSDGQALGCLRCDEPPCQSVASTSDRGTSLCPTDAINSMQSNGIQIDEVACISCGLCLLACPAGAIVSRDLGRGAVYVQPPARQSMPAALGSNKSALSEILIAYEDVSDLIEASSERLVFSAFDLTQRSFYRLVEGLFRLAGFDVSPGNSGDTSSRFDLLLLDDRDCIPVEVKSRTETQFINVKSVQQALENKIVLDSRAYPSRVESASLVVGWDYPPARSEVTELVDDIYSAFGISIGLISMKALYRLALERQIGKQHHARSVLHSLRGPL